jgi:hypothetical protein
VKPIQLASCSLALETGYNSRPNNRFHHDDQLRETVVNDGNAKFAGRSAAGTGVPAHDHLNPS